MNPEVCVKVMYLTLRNDIGSLNAAPMPGLLRVEGRSRTKEHPPILDRVLIITWTACRDFSNIKTKAERLRFLYMLICSDRCETYLPVFEQSQMLVSDRLQIFDGVIILVGQILREMSV